MAIRTTKSMAQLYADALAKTVGLDHDETVYGCHEYEKLKTQVPTNDYKGTVWVRQGFDLCRSYGGSDYEYVAKIGDIVDIRRWYAAGFWNGVNRRNQCEFLIAPDCDGGKQWKRFVEPVAGGRTLYVSDTSKEKSAGIVYRCKPGCTPAAPCFAVDICPAYRERYVAANMYEVNGCHATAKHMAQRLERRVPNAPYVPSSSGLGGGFVSVWGTSIGRK